MFPRSFRILTLSGVLAAASSASTAFGQFCPLNPCCCCPAPVRVTACLQTVPVTEYREVRQTVHRPVVETAYVDQPVTEYRQVVENKTAEIPTVCYQNVTEMRTIQRDCGHWVAQYHERPMMTPCQYDNRPDLFGFINRTGYSLRMAFTPRIWAERIYVPNVVAEQVPVTRQVAVRGTQTVNYQVAKVIPFTSTRKVAVQTVKMVAQEIVTQRPVVVYKTVPMGSSLAAGTSPAAPSATAALQPSDSPATGIYPREKNPSVQRTAKNPASLNDDGETDAFENRESNSGTSKFPKKNTTQPDHSSIKVPAATDDDAAPAAGGSSDEEEIAARDARPIGRWVARKKTAKGPAFPEIAQTGAKRAKR